MHESELYRIKIFIKHYFEHSKRTVTSTTAANATVKENDSKI